MMLLMLLVPAQSSGRSMTCDATGAAARWVAGGMGKQGAHDAVYAPCVCSEEREAYDMRCWEERDAYEPGRDGQ